MERAIDAGKKGGIPQARLLIINGMGHDMPKGVWAEIADAVSRHAQASQRLE
jgi:hypothetical protein